MRSGKRQKIKGNAFWLFMICSAAVCLLYVFSALRVQADDLADQTQPKNGISDADKVVSYGMMPVDGSFVRDGTYEVDVRSSSKYFRIAGANLFVSDGRMQVEIILDSTAYLYVYAGSAGDASAADRKDYIELEKTEAGTSFTMDVAALNQAFPCAAFSKKREKWYDRALLIDASSLPSDALSVTLPDYGLLEDALQAYEETNPDEVKAAREAYFSTDNKDESDQQEADKNTAAGKNTGSEENGAQVIELMNSEMMASIQEAVPVNLTDGEYAIEVTMTGGSGRASISSPTWLIVQDGRAFAKLLWSSTYYDYMIVGDRKYLNQTKDGGNSTFIIPVTSLNEPMEVVADTTAMGDPVAIDYVLTFYEDTIGSKNQIPQEAAKKVLISALIIMAAGGIINHFVKKKRIGA